MPTARKKKKTPLKRAKQPTKKAGAAKAKSAPKRAAKAAAKKGPAKKRGSQRTPGAKASARTSSKAAAKAARAKRKPRTPGSDDRAAAKPPKKAGKTPSASPAAKAEIGAEQARPTLGKRSFGLRGAAPWVARHAAKHAAELRERNAQPPPPGSARATLREPLQADQIKEKIASLHQRLGKLRSMSRRLERNFFEIGQLLAEIQRQELHVAKGFSSFQAFLDRETDVGRSLGLRLVRIAHTFQRETAYDFGLERLTAALAALDGELTQGSPSQPSNRSFSSTALPTKPPIRYGD